MIRINMFFMFSQNLSTCHFDNRKILWWYLESIILSFKDSSSTLLLWFRKSTKIMKQNYYLIFYWIKSERRNGQPFFFFYIYLFPKIPLELPKNLMDPKYTAKSLPHLIYLLYLVIKILAEYEILRMLYHMAFHVILLDDGMVGNWIHHAC